ncbi:hypothetical protein RN001_012937 [Aquatica leii]|uniref:Peptidase S1 domain-containing protein n=1 Tax=Aquatica leii TaxID=1421715 RepID=A0AAN7PR18_9COLE|nr:hypothetical protein RN001_012937 [Aquatica leii]
MIKVSFFVLVLLFVESRSFVDWRIVGGSSSDDGEYPYQVSQKVYNRHNCGGSIIDSSTILTAAHCVYRHPPEEMTILVGSNKLNQGGVTHPVKKYIMHQMYDQKTLQNDIALIKLSTRIHFTSSVHSIALDHEYIPGGIDCVLSGWGWISYPGSSVNKLQHVSLKTTDIDVCRDRLSTINYPILDTNICAFTKNKQGGCRGDSGGPLVANGKQIGILSWLRYCGTGVPDVFTRVSSYIDWIDKAQVLVVGTTSCDRNVKVDCTRSSKNWKYLKKYCEKIFNVETSAIEQIEEARTESKKPEDDYLAKNEVLEEMRKLRNGKSIIEDIIDAELLKNGGQALYKHTYILIKQIWKQH